jgi:tryptophan-rich sensory protein
MNLSRLSVSGVGIGLVILYAAGSGFWVSASPGWYRSLNAPSWQPPDWVFGVIWPYNFIVLGISAVIVSQRLSTRLGITWLIVFAVSIACALTWAYQFYKPHNLTAASIALALAAVSTIPLLLITYKASLPIFVALIPYQLWLTTATLLSWGYQQRN